MRIAILALLASVGLLFSGQLYKKDVVAGITVVPRVVKAEKQPVEVKSIVQPTLDYTITKNLYFHHYYNMYYYRELPQRTYYTRKYRFPILGRLLRTKIDIRGPEGRGITLGYGPRVVY